MGPERACSLGTGILTVGSELVEGGTLAGGKFGTQLVGSKAVRQSVVGQRPPGSK